MTIKQALLWATKKLNQTSNSPQLDAEILLAYLFNQPKSFLYTYPAKKLTTNQEQKYRTYIAKRKNLYPIAYITNNREFYYNNFFVDENVLIPRPETELLIDEAIKLIKKNNINHIADIGTGSGAIAITLKKLFPKSNIYATDISKPALKIAKKNATLHHAKINFLYGNLLEPLKNKSIDLLLANLPYVSYDIYHSVKSIKHEPQNALLAKNNGIFYYQNLIAMILKSKQKIKYLILEINPRQEKLLQKDLQKLKPKKILIKKDLNKKNRFIIIYL